VNIEEFLHQTCNVEDMGKGYHMQRTRPRVYCKDGFSVSMQAGEGIYCQPRRDGDLCYYMVELGYPSAPMPEIEDRAEDKGTLETVWGYVPVADVQKILDSHGGIDEAKTLKPKEKK